LDKYNRRITFFVYLGTTINQKLALKKVTLSVINDLVTDNRVHKVALSLKKMGFEPVLIGRLLPDSPDLLRDYETHRMNLFFRKGMAFYMEYNIRLFFYLLGKPVDVFVANDLDTLPANCLIAKIKRKPLIYDSHEYFTEVPELVDRQFVKSFWTTIEKLLIPKVNAAYTVCDSIADSYRNLYNVDFKVVRNLPIRKNLGNINNKSDQPDQPRVILYQGALNLGRGIESAIRAMTAIENAELWLAGDGDLTLKLKNLVAEQHLEEKVKFLGRLPIEQLQGITRKADLGISLEEDLGLNYRFSLPNKLFDYIQAGVPVLVSNLTEMRKIVEDYQIGSIAESRHPNELADYLKIALFDDEKRLFWKMNLPRAAAELCWEKEEKVLEEIYFSYL
jgi:glycosyltransferase involved in cell wall biosynthesis